MLVCVKAVFSLARKLAPCIIFVDEVDALLESRTLVSSSGGRSNRTEIINEFMSEWDGLASSVGGSKTVIVLAATNRPFVLDDAVLRRLPRRVLVDLPDAAGRLEILKVLLKDNEYSQEDLVKVSQETPLFSGSDLKDLAKQALTLAIKQSLLNKDIKVTTTTTPAIEWRHWQEALGRQAASLSRSSQAIQQLRKWNDQFGDRLDLKTAINKDHPSEESLFARKKKTILGFRPPSTTAIEASSTNK